MRTALTWLVIILLIPVLLVLGAMGVIEIVMDSDDGWM